MLVRRSYAVVVFTFFLLLVGMASYAAWSHGDYTYNPPDVLEATGNYVIAGIGPNNGNVQALTPGGGASASAIKVRYKVTYTADAGDPNKALTPTGELEGSSNANASASSTVEADSGSITRGCTGANGYLKKDTLGAIIIAPVTATPYIIARAAGSRYPGGTFNASSTVYFQ